MKNTKSVLTGLRIRAAMILVCPIVALGVAQADVLNVSASFSTFSGIVFGGGVTSPFVDGGEGSIIQAGPGDALGQPLQRICPDTGCADIGQATNYALPSGSQTVRFWLGGVSGGAPFNLPVNAISFIPTSTLGDPKSEFQIGTLTFENGEWTGDVDLGLSIRVDDATLGTEYDFQGFVHMRLTPNIGSPQVNADFLYLTNASGIALQDPITGALLPSLRVFELGDDPSGNIGSADLWATTGSLDPTRFTNVTGAAFLDPSLVDAPSGASTPEPGSPILVGAALLIWFVWRARTVNPQVRRGSISTNRF
jgi:hypothetical protein